MEPGSVIVAGLATVGGALAGYFQRGKAVAEAEPATAEALNRRLTLLMVRIEKLELAVELRDKRIDDLQEQLASERRDCEARMDALNDQVEKLRWELTG